MRLPAGSQAAARLTQQLRRQENCSMHGPTADALNCRIEDLRSSGIIREMYVALWEQGKVP
jgi:hypothetical protein